MLHDGVFDDISHLIEEALEDLFDDQKCKRSDGMMDCERELALLNRIEQLEAEITELRGKSVSKLTKKLSLKQRDVLNVIQNYIKDKGYSPTIREIGTLVNLKSPSTVYGYLERLRERGAITWDGSSPRTLKVLASQDAP